MAVTYVYFNGIGFSRWAPWPVLTSWSRGRWWPVLEFDGPGGGLRLCFPQHIPTNGSASPYAPVLKGSRWCLLKRPENCTDQQTVKLVDSQDYCCKCESYFNADMLDLAPSKSHCTHRVIALAARL